MNTPTPLYQHLAAAGGMTRKNPELRRLAEKTGFSIEHLFKVATGQRRCSRALACSIATHARNKAVTVDSVLQPSQE